MSSGQEHWVTLHTTHTGFSTKSNHGAKWNQVKVIITCKGDNQWQDMSQKKCSINKHRAGSRRGRAESRSTPCSVWRETLSMTVRELYPFLFSSIFSNPVFTDLSRTVSSVSFMILKKFILKRNYLPSDTGTDLLLPLSNEQIKISNMSEHLGMKVSSEALIYHHLLKGRPRATHLAIILSVTRGTQPDQTRNSRTLHTAEHVKGRLQGF